MLARSQLVAVLLVALGCGSSPGGAPGGQAAAKPRSAAVTIGAPGAHRTPGGDRAQPQAPQLWAWFSNASGLAVGARVIVAGLPKGRIAAIHHGPKGARIELALEPDVEIWSNARLQKRHAGSRRPDSPPVTRSRTWSTTSRSSR